MISVTKHFAIDRPVPFADVTVDLDNPRFLDPHAIRLERTPEPYASDALRCIDTFFDTVARCAMSTSGADRAYGESILKVFPEPWETRLGMSANGFRGHGGSDEVGGWIWSAMNNDLNALLRVGVLAHLEDLPLFVEGVDRDITSDITTRIIFGPLARYTEQMIRAYPEFSAGRHRPKVFVRQAWDPDLCRWVEEEVELISVDGKPLLLVPLNWTRPRLLMSAGRFYETSVLTYAQHERSVVSRAGEILTTPKRVLKKLPGLGRGRATNLAVTTRAVDNSEDLLKVFRRFVAERHATQRERDAG